MKKSFIIMAACCLNSPSKLIAEQASIRPHHRTYLPTTYCTGGFPAVRLYIGEGPLCGGWKKGTKIKAIELNIEKRKISVDAEWSAVQEPHHNKCAAWGSIYVGGILPHPGLSVWKSLAPDERAWTFEFNGISAGNLNLWTEFDPTTGAYIQKCEN